MPPKFTGNELERIAGALREERLLANANLSDEEIAAAIAAPVSLSAEEKSFLAKKRNRPPTVAELTGSIDRRGEGKVVSGEFGRGAATGLRIAASTLERPRPRRASEPAEAAKVIESIRLGVKELGVEPHAYLGKVLRQLRLPQIDLAKLAIEDLERIEKRVGRDISKTRSTNG